MATVLPPIATLVVGLIAALIAWQQWKLARQKLRLDLFDRRYKVYDATRTFLVNILRKAKFSDTELFEFCAATSDAEFLFGCDVVNYLDEIRKRSLDMRSSNIQFEDLEIGEDRSKHVQASRSQLVWLSEQVGVVQKPFLPYLGFTHVR